MRSLSAGALAQIAERFGNEPINIIEVAWNLGGVAVPYADRDVSSIPGKILELATLDNVVNVTGNGQSQEISVTLDDTDGSLKAVIDTTDIHQRSVWVYQYFEGMSLSDKFLLFKGQISSPVVYNEGDRTLSFTVVSQIEDTEIGFSAEEGQFDFVADHLIGKPWPMNFGTVTHGKTLRLDQTIRGIVAKSVGVADFALPYRRSALALVAGFYSQHAFTFATAAQKHTQFAQFYLSLANSLDPGTESARIATLLELADGEMSIADSHDQNADRFYEQAADFALGASSVLTAYNEQLATEPDTFRVIGGKEFPRGPLSLKIGDAFFTGAFIDDTDEFDVQTITHPKRDELAISNTPLETPQVPGVRIQSVTQQDTRLETTEPSLPIDFFLFDAFPPDLLSQYTMQMFGEHAGYLYFDAGSVVEIATEEGQEYIVSITPGEVLQASAFLNRNGVRKLTTVPEEYYTVIERDYGGLTAVIVRLDDALSKIELGDWEDELFVTFQSDIGPNTVDVLEYLIETYTEFSIDTASFTSAKTALTNYPSHFQITDRKQILNALSEIAWQARCAIWLSNDVFYLRYLPAVPTSVSTFTDSDVDVATLEIGFTPTEDIVTKMVCTWRATGAQEEDNVVILRHNVAKYGTKERQFDFYIYNAADFVIKSATFWLIRYANTWKKARFQTPLHKLNVESLDGVELDFNNPWIASGAVTGIVEQANYDSDSRQLSFEVWTPVRAGEMTAYDFAHPREIDQQLKFPTNAEEELDFDGGIGPGKRVGEGFTIGVPVGNFTTSYVNPDFYKMLKRRFNDRGDPHPSDQDDGPPGDPVIPETPALTTLTAGPVSPLPNNVVPTVQIVRPDSVSSGSGLTEIRFDTPIIDNVTDPENPITTTLATLLEYDPISGIHGAKLTFLWDEDDDP
jgi:hypothetical protein